MPFLSDNIFDSGLGYATTNGTRIDVCSQEPTTYAEATSTYTLGNKATTVGAVANNSPDGRKVVVAAISAGSVTATGTASHWALTDGIGELLATGTLSASQALTSGNTFDLAAIDVALRDPT